MQCEMKWKEISDTHIPARVYMCVCVCVRVCRFFVIYLEELSVVID